MFVVIIITIKHSPAVDDAFHVEHGNDFEHVGVPRLFSGDRVTAKVFNHPVDNPRWTGLAGMYARRQVHDGPVLRLRDIKVLSCVINVAQLDGVSKERFSVPPKIYALQHKFFNTYNL